jgi:HSP20 family protein
MEKQIKGQEDLKERYFGRIYRSLTLPSQVKPENVKAQMKDGILRIEMEKVEESKPRKIQIE